MMFPQYKYAYGRWWKEVRKERRLTGSRNRLHQPGHRLSHRMTMPSGIYLARHQVSFEVDWKHLKPELVFDLRA